MQEILGVSGRAWIGVSEAVVLLDELHGAVVEVLPASGAEMEAHLGRLSAHFESGGGPFFEIGGGPCFCPGDGPFVSSCFGGTLLAPADLRPGGSGATAVLVTSTATPMDTA